MMAALDSLVVMAVVALGAVPGMLAVNAGALALLAGIGALAIGGALGLRDIVRDLQEDD